MARTYLGIDFANRAPHQGQCIVEHDGNTLLVAVGANPNIDVQDYVRIGVDCPFGTTCGFEAVLRGEPFNGEVQDLKYRHTERRIKNEVVHYHTVRDWNALPAGRGHAYFNAGSHIQPSLGLVIVPECIFWIQEKLAAQLGQEERIAALESSRDGSGNIIEAHPRMFLYSALERLRIHDGEPLDVDVLRAARDYKSSDEEIARCSRERVLSFLVSKSYFLGIQGLEIRFANEVYDGLVDDDHRFDAFLAALTAHSHDNLQTKTWQQIGIAQEHVSCEGHMLILRQEGGTSI